MGKAVYYTARELAQRDMNSLPDEFVSDRHLIYSSPATLAFNSPGAEGFGVKRAGLAIPNSVMLLVSPGCCGRNTSLVSSMRQYQGRFFYLTMNEADLVTGRHLKKIPQAVWEVVESLPRRPSVVMICITCVDALLGTDMERVCRKAEELVQLPVRPCYMYALTREGRRPPMVHVRQSLYSLLEPRKKRGTSVNLLGYFSPLQEDCELYSLLAQAGVKNIREISRCQDFEEFQLMAEANFNLVLHPEARFAANDLEERLKIPSIELRRLYQIDQIAHQYEALGRVLGVKFSFTGTLGDNHGYMERAKNAMKSFRGNHLGLRFAIGECLNGDPFELALALVRYGFVVSEIYGTVKEDNLIFLRHLGELSPETRVFSNLDPSMLYYEEAEDVDVAIGKDAAYYNDTHPSLHWNQESQPFGFAGVQRLFESLTELLEEKPAGEVEPSEGRGPK